MIAYVILFVAALSLCILSTKANFGRGLLLFPLLISLVGVRHAVPMLAVAQLMTAAACILSNAAYTRWRTIGWFLLGAMPCCAAGALLFVTLPEEAATRLIGAAILFFVLAHRFNTAQTSKTPFYLIARGTVVGALSGLTGSSASLGLRVFAAQGLAPSALIASLAAVGVAIHGMKMVVYQRFIEFDLRFWRLTAVITGAMLVSSRLVQPTRRPEHASAMQRAVEVCLLLAAAYLLIHGTAP